MKKYLVFVIVLLLALTTAASALSTDNAKLTGKVVVIYTHQTGAQPGFILDLGVDMSNNGAVIPQRIYVAYSGTPNFADGDTVTVIGRLTVMPLRVVASRVLLGRRMK